MPDFIPGLRLCKLFYGRAVRPVLDRHFAEAPHGVAFGSVDQFADSTDFLGDARILRAARDLYSPPSGP